MVQIPCLNEADDVAAVIRRIPRRIDCGVICYVDVIVIDDGSTDDTSRVARTAGADMVVSLGRNRGLARAFAIGVECALSRGADIVVNLDADGQYAPAEIEALLRPIILNEADVVIGMRDVGNLPHFSRTKRLLQRIGNVAIRRVTRVPLSDATSGFRAMDAEAAAAVSIHTRFSYTIETLILWGDDGFRVVGVPVSASETRSSRLFRSNRDYLMRTAKTLIQAYWIYRPRSVMTVLALVCFLPGVIVIARFLTKIIDGSGQGHIQSLILGSALVLLALQFFIGGFIAHLVATNRLLLLRVDRRLKQGLDHDRGIRGTTVSQEESRLL